MPGCWADRGCDHHVRWSGRRVRGVSRVSCHAALNEYDDRSFVGYRALDNDDYYGTLVNRSDSLDHNHSDTASLVGCGYPARVGDRQLSARDVR